ncbi:MAG TPA: hypothetical protein VF171_03170 [Trueperaceae bacterium]
MRLPGRFRPRLLLALLALLVPGAFARQQAGPEPIFITETEALRLAYATEALGIQLQALTVHNPAPVDGEAEKAAEGEEGEEGPAPLDLFAASLAQVDPALLEDLTSALGEVERIQAADADGLREAVEHARSLVDQAREVLVPQALQADPVFRAALLVKLDLSEVGPGEGYEEAAHGQQEAFAVGFSALQRLKALWAGLLPELPAGATTQKVEQALADFDALMPTAQPPARYRDPEDAETAAQDLAFGLEAATDQTLFPHDFQTALALVEHDAQAACASAGAGKQSLAIERTLATSLAYRKHIADSLAFIMPELNTTLLTLLQDKLPQAIQTNQDAHAICKQLQEALASAGGT